MVYGGYMAVETSKYCNNYPFRNFGNNINRQCYLEQSGFGQSHARAPSTKGRRITAFELLKYKERLGLTRLLYI